MPSRSISPLPLSLVPLHLLNMCVLYQSFTEIILLNPHHSRILQMCKLSLTAESKLPEVMTRKKPISVSLGLNLHEHYLVDLFAMMEKFCNCAV